MGVRPRILVVDDDRSVLLTFSMIFQQQGYEAVACSTLDEARQAIEADGYALLICDLSIAHGRGGLEVIEYARQRAPSVPAILLTGFASGEIAREAARQNIILIIKPVEVRELLKTIATLAGPGERAG